MPATNDLPPLPPRREPVLRALADICGPDFARTARSIDTVGGRRVSFVSVPATARQVEDTLRVAAERGLAAMARGSGSKIDWGTPPPGVDLLVDTGRLGGLWNHRPSELTAEVGTGTPVRALQAALALRGQRLAVDPPSRSATIGGMLAVNESGPLRHKYGTPAGQVAGVGYVDLTGSRREAELVGDDFEGVILSAALRLEPLPAARRWVSVPVSTPLQVHNLVDEALAQQVDPSAVEVDLPTPAPGRTVAQPPGSVAVLLEGGAQSVVERSGRLAKILGPGAEIAELAPSWWGRYPFGPKDVALRISVRIEDLHAAVYALRDAASGPVPVRGSAGVGTVHAVLPGNLDPERIERIVDTVRSILMARSGRAVIVSAPPATARDVDMAGRRELF
ncbi:FAD-binding oxidoreductase [Actinoplanes sp. NBRC 103695]|uniref:FAD-binding oxidoreductase n=1 Tax=Actinoplanes sp. NBRC 103695 TaxID=3032202 RepID=UPI0024A5B3FE|nr:FAD-binding oxidoreductase [Actinoplanes sp. NBRC 103695]GLY99924.1 glycolate oxidase [Actinoplanes sp. NBRC 103695]